MDNLPDTPTELTVESSPKSEEDEALDPRVQVCFLNFPLSKTLFILIQIELERLNYANEAINNLELQLDVIFTKKIFLFFLFIHLGSS
jgi:hypothetical protein